MKISRTRLGVLSLLLLSLLVFPALASAATRTQGGADMVVINPGGGVALNGSDGLQSVFNGAEGYKPVDPGQEVPVNGSDQQFFARTGQWCCGGSAPNIYVGPAGSGTLIGNGNVFVDGAENWDTVEIVSTSGSAVRVETGTDTLPDGFTTGSGGAVIRYTKSISGRTYIVERTINYQYPNSYYSESWTFTIPSGNTDPVQFYQGGDAAPGGSDAGRGMMATSPRRVLYEINSSSGIYIAYGETPGGSLIDHWFVGQFYTPGAWMLAGENLDDSVNASPVIHDAGIQMQWTIPATPGTYTRTLQTIVNFQNTALSVGFSDADITTSETSDLQIQLLNTLFTSVEALGFTYSLPSGLTIAGAATSDCGGTLIAAGTSIDLSAASVAAASSCTVTVPVRGLAGSYTIRDQDFSVSGDLVKAYGAALLTVTGPSPPTTSTVTIDAPQNGSVSSDPAGIDCGSLCSGSFTNDSEVTLTAKPAAGYKFSSWTGACAGQGNPCKVKITGALSVKPVFIKLTAPKLALSITSRSKTLKAGQILPVTINVKNSGEATATSTKVCFRVPSGFSFLSATRPYSLAKGLVCWKLGDLVGSENTTAAAKAARAAGSKTVKVNLRTLKSAKPRLVTLRATVTAGNVAGGTTVKAAAKTKVKVKQSKVKPEPVTG